MFKFEIINNLKKLIMSKRDELIAKYAADLKENLV